MVFINYLSNPSVTFSLNNLFLPPRQTIGRIFSWFLPHHSYLDATPPALSRPDTNLHIHRYPGRDSPDQLFFGRRFQMVPALVFPKRLLGPSILPWFCQAVWYHCK